MIDDHIRLCPVCGTENPPTAGHCASCATLLIGVDLSPKSRSGAAPAPSTPETAAKAVPPREGPGAIVCPHADCGASNPPGEADCLYCGRSLQATPASQAPVAGLYRLPSALAVNFGIERVLPASGAEAELMLLRGIRTGARVMAKLYRPGIAPKGEVLERVAEVAYAHVVRLLAHGVSDGLAYEVMEYCAGGSLRDLMQEKPTTAQLRDILTEIAEALAALHACHVIHRDLKPENVLVRRREPLDLVLTDFGIASLNDATQLFTETARTARYAAPEALTGVLDQAADYWSLGMMLVEMLTDEHPFAALSEPVIAHRLATSSVNLDAVVDPAWRKLCRGLLQRDPKRRWDIAEVRRWLADDATLGEPLHDASVLAHPYRIAGIACGTHDELAAAFSRHWEAAAKDLARGQFESWVREELKDHDLLRFLHDLKERGGGSDLHLFRLIRHLAPAIPPAWRGESLKVENVIAKAAQAYGGDGQVADWLASLFETRVLELLPAADFPDERRLEADWRNLWREFVDTWQQAGKALGNWQQQRVARGEARMDVDTLMFGQVVGLERPPAGSVHASLLMVMVNPEMLSELRAKAYAETAVHLEHSPWLDEVMRLAEASASGAIALGFLLPIAKQASAEGQQALADRQERRADDVKRLAHRANEALVSLRAELDGLGVLFGTDGIPGFSAKLDEFLALGQEARGLIGSGSLATSPTMRAIARAEPLIGRMQAELDSWRSARRINEVWRTPHLGNAAAGFAVFLLLFAPTWLPVALAVPAVAISWRYWVLSGYLSTIRKLAASLPWQIPTANG